MGLVSAQARGTGIGVRPPAPLGGPAQAFPEPAASCGSSHGAGHCHGGARPVPPSKRTHPSAPVRRAGDALDPELLAGLVQAVAALAELVKALEAATATSAASGPPAPPASGGAGTDPSAPPQPPVSGPLPPAAPGGSNAPIAPPVPVAPSDDDETARESQTAPPATIPPVGSQLPAYDVWGGGPTGGFSDTGMVVIGGAGPSEYLSGGAPQPSVANAAPVVGGGPGMQPASEVVVIGGDAPAEITSWQPQQSSGDDLEALVARLQQAATQPQAGGTAAPQPAAQPAPAPATGQGDFVPTTSVTVP